MKGSAIDMTAALPPDLRTHPALQGAIVTATARSGSRQQVLEIRQDGQPVILKRYLGPSAPARFAAAIARLAEADARMGGDNLAVRILRQLPDCHTLILSRAAGRPLQDALQLSDDARQAILVRRAGEWLACLVGTAQARPFLAWKVFVRLSERAAAYAADEAIDPELVRRHMERMHQLARQIHLQPVGHGMAHGDFHPENLFIDEPGDRLILTGFDLEMAAPIPVIRDLAKMLVWLQGAALPRQPGPCVSGIHQPLFDSLCAGYAALGPADRLALHFHIGEQMLEFYLQRGARLPEIRHRMAPALDHWGSEP